MGHAGHGVGSLFDQITERTSADLEGSSAGLHAFEVEDVVDEADEAVGVGDGDAEEVLRLGVEGTHDAGGEQAEGAADAGKGSAELVRDGGDELVLEVVEVRALAELAEVLLVQLVGALEVGGELGAVSPSSCEQDCERGACQGENQSDDRGGQGRPGNQVSNRKLAQ